MFNGIIRNTDAIETFFLWVIEYNDGNCYCNMTFPNHLSSQNWILLPLLSLKWSRLRKESLTQHEATPKL
jgi:hypothetical protein